MKYKRFVIIGDGEIYHNNGKFYVKGEDGFEYISCLEGIEEVIIWSRIWDINDYDIKKYNEISCDYEGKKIIITGIYNQKHGGIGYLCSFLKRLRGLKEILSTPCVVSMVPLSVSQWMAWFCFNHQDKIYIGRMMGYVESLLSDRHIIIFKNMLNRLITWICKNYLKSCVLNSFVSKGLLEQYGNNQVPSVVYHDTMIREKDLSLTIKKRETSDLVLIFVGRLVIQKGVKDLLISLKELKELQIRLLIVGDGNDKDYFMNLVSKLCIEDKVDFMGEIKWGKNLFDIYKKADCLILPSYKEGFGMVCLEAMAMGIPVIGSNNGGMADIIINEHNGLMVEAGNIDQIKKAITRIYYDEELRYKMAKNALETAKSNTRERQLEKFRNIYLSTVYPLLNSTISDV